MPISIDEFRFPRFIRHEQQNPFIEDRKAKFLDGSFNGLRRFHGESFPQPGYNSSANITSIRPINLDQDDLSFPPTI